MYIKPVDGKVCINAKVYIHTYNINICTSAYIYVCIY